MVLVYVAVGGAVGSMCRYLTMNWVSSFTSKEFPYGTLAVNILGSFLLGLLIAFLVTILPRGRELHALIAVGFLGGFTTFSAFSMDVYLLMEKGQMMAAATYIILSVTVSVLALFFGMWCFRAFAA